MGILKVLVVILILLFPLGEMGRISIYNEVSITINDIAVGMVVAVWFGLALKNKKIKEAHKARLFKPIIIFVAIALMSLLINLRHLSVFEFFASFSYFIRFVMYASLYFVVRDFSKEFKIKILYLLIFSGSIIVFGGLIQYFLYPSLKNLAYMGWDEHLYRLFSSYFDPNFAAVIINLFLVILLSMLLLKTINNYKINMIFLILAGISFISLLLTYSRSGYLMFFMSVLFLLAFLRKKKIIAFILLIFFTGIIFLPKDFEGEGVKLLRSASIESRVEYIRKALVIFFDNPVLGVGFNTYRYAQYRYGFIDDANLPISHAGAGTDNSFIFVLATTGIVGFISYIYLWYKILNMQKTNMNSSINKITKIWKIVVISSSAGLFINAFFINSLFYPFVMEWLWIIIAITDNK